MPSEGKDGRQSAQLAGSTAESSAMVAQRPLGSGSGAGSSGSPAGSSGSWDAVRGSRRARRPNAIARRSPLLCATMRRLGAARRGAARRISLLALGSRHVCGRGGSVWRGSSAGGPAARAEARASRCARTSSVSSQNMQPLRKLNIAWLKETLPKGFLVPPSARCQPPRVAVCFLRGRRTATVESGMAERRAVCGESRHLLRRFERSRHFLQRFAQSRRPGPICPHQRIYTVVITRHFVSVACCPCALEGFELRFQPPTPSLSLALSLSLSLYIYIYIYIHTHAHY